MNRIIRCASVPGSLAVSGILPHSKAGPKRVVVVGVVEVDGAGNDSFGRSLHHILTRATLIAKGEGDSQHVLDKCEMNLVVLAHLLAFPKYVVFQMCMAWHYGAAKWSFSASKCFYADLAIQVR